MSKICNCHRLAIKDLILKNCNHNNDQLGTLLTEIIVLLESDCVCEKKEIFKNPCFFCPYVASSEDRNESTTLIVSHNRVCKNRKVRLCEPGNHNYQPTGVTLLSSPPLYPHQCTNCGDVKNFERPVVAEKQSQSPCEHKWEETWTIHGLDGGVHKKLFCCSKPKCGLVTCIDPRGSGPSKNSNDK